MQNKKTIAIIVGVIAAVSLLAATKQLQLFRAMDYLVLLKAGILFFLAYFTSTLDVKEEKNAWLAAAPDILWKLFLLLGAIALMKRGFDIYREGAMIKALIFFPLGLFFVFMFWFISDKTPRQMKLTGVVYRKDSNIWVAAPVKFIIAFALAYIGVYLIKKGHWLLADFSFLVSLVQLLLIYMQNGLMPEKPEQAEQEIPLTIGKKILSMALIAAALYFYYCAYEAITGYDFKNAFVCFILASSFFGLAPGGSGFKKDPENEDKFNWFDAAYAVFIFLFGLRLFSWDLFNIPPGVHGDEGWGVSFAKQMENINYGIYMHNEEANGPTLHYWIIHVLFKGIGITVGSLKAYQIAATSSMLVISYFIFKNFFNRTIGVLATVFTACFFMTLLYSRIGIVWMHSPLLACATFYFFYKALKKGNMIYFVLSGLFMGLGQYFYNAGKIVPVFYLIYMPLLMINSDNRGKIMSNWKGVLMLFTAAVIIYLPLVDHMIYYPNYFFGRIGKVSLIHHMPPTIEEIKNITVNIIKNIQMFFTLSANGYCHNLPQKPFFDSMTGYWALVGLGFLAFTWKKEASLFAIGWLVTGLLPGFLSSLGLEDPFPSRVVLAIPVIGLVIVIGMERLMAKLSVLWPNIFKPVAPFLYAGVLAFFVFYNFNNFFVMYKNDPHTIAYYRNTDKTVADEITKNYDTTTYKLSPSFWDSYYFGRTKYLSSPYSEKNRMGYDASIFQLFSQYNQDKRNVSVVGEGLYYKSLPIFKEYYPGAEIKVVWDNNFWQFDTTSNIKYCYEWKYPDAVIYLNKNYAWFYTFDSKVPFVSVVFANIPFKDIEALATLDVMQYSSGILKNTVKLATNSVSFDGTFDKAVINGLIDIPDYKSYEFVIENGDGEIYLNGRQIKGPQMLYAGLHRIKVILKKNGTGVVNLKWKQEGQGVSDIAKGILVNSNKVFGLLAEYRELKENKAVYQSLEPDIQQRFYWPSPRPAYTKSERRNDCNIKWTGYIDVPASGNYEFKFETGYTAKVNIDGKTVYEKTAKPGKVEEIKYRGDDEKITGVFLAKGRKPVVINAYYHYIDKYWYETASMRFMYKIEGHKEFGPVTYDMLSPGF